MERVGVWRWFARSLAARPGGHKLKRTKTGQVRPQPGQASANYDRLRGEGEVEGEGEGRRGERFNVVNHTQVLERRSAVQFGSGFGPKCVFTLDGSQE
jgi:hypothetical protein